MAGSAEPSPIKAIVDKVILDLGSSSKVNEHRPSKEDIERLWKKAAGGFASRKSTPVSLRKGRLVVNVEDSSLLYNLTLRKREILESLRKALSAKIQDIQFRIGETGGKESTKHKAQNSKQRK